MLKDPLVRRFFSASFFAAAFVWVAVTYFNVDTEVVWVFFLLSVGFVLLLILGGLFLAPLVALFKPKPSMLTKLKLTQVDQQSTELEKPIPLDTENKDAL